MEWANFNYIAHACYHPNDAYYSLQWPLARMNMEPAWDITRGTSSVVVAVCDMGFYFAHEDWAGILTTSPRDAIGNDNDPSIVGASIRTAEHVAGTIFAATNNGLGIAGIAPLCTLMPVRVLDDSGQRHGLADRQRHLLGGHARRGRDQPLARALPSAACRRIRDRRSPRRFTQAASANVVVCAATGNDAAAYVAYPAAYATCIAVGATGLRRRHRPLFQSRLGIDLVAPGGNTRPGPEQRLATADGVLSTLHNGAGDHYGFWQGTSMATPHVAGLAALLLARGVQPAQVRQALQETAVDLGAHGLGPDLRLRPRQCAGRAAVELRPRLKSRCFPRVLKAPFPPAGWEVDQTGAPIPTAGASFRSSVSERRRAAARPTAAPTPPSTTTTTPRAMQIDWLTTPAISLARRRQPTSRCNFWQRNYWVAEYYHGTVYHGVLWSTDNVNFTELDELDAVQETWAEVTLDLTSHRGTDDLYRLPLPGRLRDGVVSRRRDV